MYSHAAFAIMDMCTLLDPYTLILCNIELLTLNFRFGSSLRFTRVTTLPVFSSTSNILAEYGYASWSTLYCTRPAGVLYEEKEQVYYRLRFDE